ncbi:MAG: RluA family pseudouridine synthase [Eubacteriales bacterium]|jgi:23S rRNA pseudouridine1911/1915/1917 synthase|nr:RluA family pseudouridine synthase [Clostridiales bacterium]
MEELDVQYPVPVGQRLDVYIAERERISRSAAQKLIESGAVTVNGEEKAKNYRLREGDIVECELPEPVPADAQPEDIPLDIVWEDDSLLVVNKPKGMVVHPAPGHPSGTLVNALLYHCGKSLSGIGGVLRPGIVHRIDRDTSGLLCVAKTDEAHESLARQLASRTLQRRYRAVVIGNIKNESGTVSAPVGRHPVDRKKMAVVPGGRAAVTHYKVVERYRGYTQLALQLETGRTHQIRVHMAHIGHPVLGDPVYGRKTKWERAHEELLCGQCLHAKSLELIHPKTGEQMHFDSPLPDYFTETVRLLKNE